MTTVDVIKLLPIDDELKTQLVTSYETMNPRQRFSIERLAWKTYDMLYQEEFDKNALLQSQKIIKGEDSSEDFAKKVQQKTDQMFLEKEEQATQKVDLEAARKAMEFIIQEIQASKKMKKLN